MASLLAAMATAMGLASASNMNPQVRYIVANPLPGHEEDTQAFRGQHFEVLSPPIRSRYSEVVWRTLDAVLLPEPVRRRYNGSVMAITGFEVDVVRRADQGEVSVPCYESYNHHYTAMLRGRHAAISKRKGPDMGHGPMLRFDAKGGSKVPQVAAFNEHNGNEARQSFHGLPEGYVQPIESPESFIFAAMQINTRNPDGSGKRGGPLPRASAAPPNASYSGLLECPCTTRIKKVLAGHMAQGWGQCGDSADGGGHMSSRGQAIPGAAECFEAAAALFAGPISVRNSSASAANLPPGCSTRAASPASFETIFNDFPRSRRACGAEAGKGRAVGRQHSLVELSLDVDESSGSVRITIVGDDGAWFGIGFDAAEMADLPYTIVVDGFGLVTERQLDNHAAGQLLEPMLRVVANSVTGGKRTVVLTRALVGRTPAHFTFSAEQSTIRFINALGGTPQFAQHASRASSSISLLQIGGATCICRKAGGTIDGVDFDPQCPSWPLSDLAEKGNPSCDLRTYVGGMACCRDGVFLLDADQEIPPYTDEVFFKWRFYFTDYNAETQRPVFHLEWALNGCDSGGPVGIRTACRHIEYDVPRAPTGTPPSEAIHTVTSHFRLGDMMDACDVRADPYCADPAKVTAAGVQLLVAGGHCHAPACLSLELWDADSGDLLCRVAARRGAGDAAMDEEGYLWLPPCLWGEASAGLRRPPVLHLGTNLTAVKRANASSYHYGVMAIWQMRAAYASKPVEYV